MAASPLRDPVEGGFFRYATRRDWGEPHYERMLYDNALLLDAYTRAWQRTGADWAADAADGIAGFLLDGDAARRRRVRVGAGLRSPSSTACAWRARYYAASRRRARGCSSRPPSTARC